VVFPNAAVARFVGTVVRAILTALQHQRLDVTKSLVGVLKALHASDHALGIAELGTLCDVKGKRSVKSECGISGEKKD